MENAMIHAMESTGHGKPIDCHNPHKTDDSCHSVRKTRANVCNMLSVTGEMR